MRTLASMLPANLAASILYVQHLSPRSPGLLPELLSQAGPLRAAFASEGEGPARGTIHIAPPDRHMLLDARGLIRLSRGARENRSRPAIDPTFRSVALAFGPRAVGVILTGCLDDGAAGLNAISLGGGVCLVQEPASAEAPGMPSAALRLVESARSVPLADLSRELVALVEERLEEAGRVPSRTPREIAVEAAIAAGDMDALAKTASLGRPSMLTCPECHGILFELGAGKPVERFRCHTGHAFTSEALLASVRESTEHAI